MSFVAAECVRTMESCEETDDVVHWSNVNGTLMRTEINEKSHLNVDGHCDNECSIEGVCNKDHSRSAADQRAIALNDTAGVQEADCVLRVYPQNKCILSEDDLLRYSCLSQHDRSNSNVYPINCDNCAENSCSTKSGSDSLMHNALSQNALNILVGVKNSGLITVEGCGANTVCETINDGLINVEEISINQHDTDMDPICEVSEVDPNLKPHNSDATPPKSGIILRASKSDKGRQKRFVSFSDSCAESESITSDFSRSADESSVKDESIQTCLLVREPDGSSCNLLSETEPPNESEDNVRNASDAQTRDSDVRSHGSGKRRSQETNGERKESFEQRFRRTFSIKNRHTSEVTRRFLAVLNKYSLFVFNFISWVISVVAIGLGVWMEMESTFFVPTDTDFYLDLRKLMFIGGGITFVVAFLGCIGALRENLILLQVFFYVLTLILLGEVCLSTAVFIIYTVPEAKDNFLRSQPEKLLTTAIQRYMDDEPTMMWVDKIQSDFKCCGVGGHTEEEGFRDWQNNQYYNCSKTNRSVYRCAVPKSCCIFKKGDRVNTMCGFDMTDKPMVEVRDFIYTRGCIVGFGEWLGKYHNLIIISSISIMIMQFLAVVSAKMMTGRIRKQRSRWQLLQRSLSSGSDVFASQTL